MKSPCTLLFVFFKLLIAVAVAVDIDTPLHWVGLAGVLYTLLILNQTWYAVSLSRVYVMGRIIACS